MLDRFAKPVTQADEIRDLRLMNYALLALISALPAAGQIDLEDARAALDKVVDPSDDIIENDQIARIMHFVRVVVAQAQAPKFPAGPA